MVKRFFFIIIVLIILSSGAIGQGDVVSPREQEIPDYEISLEDLGYDDFSVSGTEEEDCTEFSFNQQGIATRLPVLSLHFLLGPIGINIAGYPDISGEIFLDGNNTAFREITPKDFANNWIRINIPEKMEDGASTDVKVCLKTSNTITSITLLKDSMYGEYFKEDFSNPLGFRKTIANKRASVGEEFEITVTLENMGSVGTFVKIIHRLPELEGTLDFMNILRGDTGFEGIVPGCQIWEESICTKPGSVSFSYIAKSSRATQLTLLPAVLEYENIFGETVKMESTRETIYITEPGLKLKPVLLAEAELLKPNEKTGFSLTVKNEGAETLYNPAVFIEHSNGILVEGKKLHIITSINPGESKRFNFSVSSPASGTYSVGCRIVYLEVGEYTVNCEPVEVKVEEAGIAQELIYAAILLLFGVLIYVFIITRKK